MDERLKELAEQAEVSFHYVLGATYTYGKLSEVLERFAEFIRQDERDVFWKLCKELWDSEGANANDCVAAIKAIGDE